MTIAASKEIHDYFDRIKSEVDHNYEIANEVRKKGYDPEEKVDIPLAKNMAERVTGLISIAAPQLLEEEINKKVTSRIQELEKEYSLLDWRVALKIAEEVAKEKFCKFKDKIEAMEIGIRMGFAYLTLGIVSAPLEGFTGLKIKKRKDGKEYFALKYAGPVRGAGGTGAAVSSVIGDYVRIKMGYEKYDPDEKEINRCASEIHDYHDRVTNLQYHPSDDEIKFLAKNMPVEIDGDPTEKFEVSNYKDIPRIETNRIRGGFCLVFAEGISQKSPKIWKRLSKWGKDFGLEWDFLEEFLDIQKKVKAAAGGNKKTDQSTEEKIKPNYTYISDLVAGRPILTHPLASGGFRLRYGRTRVSGFTSAALHPATQQLLNKYIAIGTQLKMERPTKGASVSVCDTIEGPIVKLKDQTVLQINSISKAKEVNQEVEEILFLGDILFDYGDFSEFGHILVPPGYCPEWWILELEKSAIDLFGNLDLKKLGEKINIDLERLQKIFSSPTTEFPTIEEAIKISQETKIPLHPNYTFHWKLAKKQDLLILREWLLQGNFKKDQDKDQDKFLKIILPLNEQTKIAKEILENIGLPHKVINKENIVIETKESIILSVCFNFNNQEDLKNVDLNKFEGDNALDIINQISKIKLRDKSGTFIGARMGRPEKAKMRKMTGSPHAMFPIGQEGDRLRCFQSALQAGKVRADFPLLYCSKCKKETIYSLCEICQNKTTQKYFCRFCGDLDEDNCKHGKAQKYKTQDLKIKYYFDNALKKLEMKTYPDLIKGVRGTSNKDHLPENLTKGILRAKHNIYVNKDSTTRYDCTEQPITHFKSKEIYTSVEKLKELGYQKDIYGKELTDKNQVLELFPQDIILPGYDSLEGSAPQVLFQVANFIDELLIKLYGFESFYNLKSKEDIIGHLVVGLAPHTSAGLIGRIIGFSQTQSLLAHPMYHAGLRRDCDGDEAAVMLLMDALLNFSRQYLPESRGAKTMDAPLVITAILNPSEIDDQVHGLGVVWKYPLELYEAALEYKNPWDIKIEQLGNRLEKPSQYQDMGFTHKVDDFNQGIQCSAYKTLPTMEEKLNGQMEIANKVRAVDKEDVAKLVIEKHFLKDIRGNLRKFSTQQFRCVKCNEKYRRPPLSNKCTKCNHRLLFTITEGSVVKYLAHSLRLAEDYDFSPYLKQCLEIVQENIYLIFGKEKDKQVGLGGFIG
ncbi:DNA polymerase II large subunit [Nanoarchaeota archaeon]